MRRIKKEQKKGLALFLVVSMIIVFLGGNIEGVNFLVAEASTTEEVTKPNIDGVLFDNESETGSAVGTDENPFKISTDAQLYRLATLIQGDESFEGENGSVKYAECSYVLANDINMSFTAWKRIGTSGYPFSGSFDGNNHTISGINISADTLQSQSIYDTYRYVGVFGVVQDCTIKNLNINSSSINMLAETVPLKCAGLLIGGIKRNGDVTVENCHVTNSSICAQSEVFGVVTTDSDDFDESAYCSYMVGGLIGGSEVSDSDSGNITIKNCSNGAHVLSKGFRNVGGIIGGMQYGTISDCSNSGVVEGNRNVGGIIGKFDNTVSLSGCSNNNQVTGLEYTDKIWTNFSSGMTDAYEGFWGNDFTAQKAISQYGSGYYIGGIAGYAGGDIVSAENSGEIKGSSDIGGIAGAVGGVAKQLENTGKISTISYTSKTIQFPCANGSESVSVDFVSEEKNAGGIAGSIISSNSALSDCINQGDVSGAEAIGGILGNANVIIDTTTCPVKYSYNTGEVSATKEEVYEKLVGTGQKTQRSYYLADITNTEEDNAEGDGIIEQKSQREFSSGEVCYFLDHDDNGTRNIWSQKIGVDTLPRLAGEEDLISQILQVKISTMFSEETWSRFNYCNKNDSVKDAADITEDAGYEYSYYLVGTGGIDDLTTVSETQAITQNCHIAVKREIKTETSIPTETPTSTATPSAITTATPSAVKPYYPTVSSTASPTPEPTVSPTVEPTETPTIIPTETPSLPTTDTDMATPTPTPTPTVSPTVEPMVTPTATPSSPAINSPTEAPTLKPSSTPKPGEKGSVVVRGEKKYEITGKNTAKIKGVNSKTSKLNIPNIIKVSGKTMKVTEIAEKAFANNKKLSNVSIGKNIKIIKSKAFSKCINLKNIKFSSNTQTIGNKCFENCTKLKTISLPNSIKTIGNEAFKNCKILKKVTIGKNPKLKKGEVYSAGFGERMLLAGKLKLKISIGNGAFQSCTSLRSVIINTQVRIIGNSAFRNCKKLSAIVVRSLILKTVGKKALLGVTECKISVPKKKFSPYRKLFKNKGQGKKVFVAKA